MKRVATVIGTAGLLAAGMTAAVALGSGSGARDGTVSTTATNATTAQTTTIPKVWLCHHTGSWKHPYHLIHVSGHAVAAHRRHGDVTRAQVTPARPRSPPAPNSTARAVKTAASLERLTANRQPTGKTTPTPTTTRQPKATSSGTR